MIYPVPFQKWEEFFNKTDVNEQKLLSSEQWDSFNGEIFNFFPRFGSNCSEGQPMNNICSFLFSYIVMNGLIEH